MSGTGDEAPDEAPDEAGPDTDTYALKAASLAEIPAPDLPWRPPAPKGPAPAIALIGAGGIAASHLDAYRTAGWPVRHVCSRTPSKAQARAAEYCPQARVGDDFGAVLSDPEVGIVDITPHPADRLALIEAALKAGKHVLSQKPFVLDLDEGERLARLAEDNGVKLAVNQNGQWAPHHAYMRAAVQAGLIGEPIAAHIAIHWNHGWIVGTPFEAIEDLVFYDFGIHWFDFVATLVGERAESIFATAAHASGQKAKVPLMAQAVLRLSGGQASFVFDGAVPHGPCDTTFIAGTAGSLRSDGPDLGHQAVTLTTQGGVARPVLEGSWFNDGFRGTMGELMCAIEEDREPLNGARANLRSLAHVFAAIESRHTGREVAIGSVRRIAL